MTCGLVPVTLIGPPRGPFGVEMLTPCSRMHRVKLRVCCSLSVLVLAFGLEPEPPHATSTRLASAHGTSRTGLVEKDIGLLSPRRWRRWKVDAHIQTDAAESSLREVDEDDEQRRSRVRLRNARRARRHRWRRP